MHIFFICVCKMPQNVYLTFYQKSEELISAKIKEYYQKKQR